MTAFPTYPRYKNSGVEWLGDVPEHWEVSRSRRVFVQRKELARPDDQQLSATQAYGVIPQADFEDRIGRKVTKISMHLEKRKHVEPDDFVISMRSFQGGLERAWARGCIRSSYTILQPSLKVAPSYFTYLLKSPQYIAALQATGSFIRDGQDLTYENFILVDLPLPPFEEQACIGSFLDQKTAEIDTLIAKKQRQIELLDEQKAILINRAVTRGLNPNAKLKPSGIEWIGEIPEHWEMKKFRYCAQIRGGQVDPRKEPHRSAVLIAPDHIESGTGRILGLNTAKEQGAESGKYQVQAGDLIYSKIRPNLRKACIAPIDCLCSADMYAVTTTDQLLPKFLLGYMLSEGFTKAAVDAAMRVAMPKVNRESLAGFPVVLPPQNEQILVISWLAELEKSRRNALHSIESQIESLNTLRSTLIAHAVTGRFKVK